MGEDELSEADRQFIDDNFEEYGSGWSDEGLAGLERDFEISAKVGRRQYILKLELRAPAGFQSTMTIRRPSGELSNTGCAIPKGSELSANEMKQVDQALQREAKVYLLEPSNGTIIPLDVSGGSEGLKHAALDRSVCFDESNKPMVHPPRGLVTRRRGEFACLYFVSKDGWQDTFCLWLHMTPGPVSIAGAAWADIPATKGGLLDAQTYAFVDKSMRSNGDFGVYGSVAGGMEDLLTFMEVGLQYTESEAGNAYWAVSATPKNGHGHFLHFQIDALTGAIEGCMAGHFEPEPEPDFGFEGEDPDIGLEEEPPA